MRKTTSSCVARDSRAHPVADLAGPREVLRCLCLFVAGSAHNWVRMQDSASTISLAWSLCVLVAACQDCPDKPDDCIEHDLTSTQGIYGQVLEGDDVIHDTNCKQYAQPVSYPVWLETADGVHVADDVADDRGAFELVAASGQYNACVRDNNNTLRCGGMVTVPTSGRMRYDILTSVISTFVSVRGPSLCGREP